MQDINLDWTLVVEDQAEEIKQIKLALSVEKTKVKQLIDHIRKLEDELAPKDEVAEAE